MITLTNEQIKRLHKKLLDATGGLDGRKEYFMKKVVFFSLIITLLLLTIPAYAASQTVSVKIAEFPVALNGLQVGNNHLNRISENSDYKYYAQYPLLVYKDITYFPMTFYYSELLNLDTSWSQEKGLVISQGNPDRWKEFRYDSRDTRNNVNQTASIVGGQVTVNGKLIDNAKEQYPLLLFRDVTYFPLTWRFAVDEFSWRYDFNASDGLRIDSNNSISYLAAVSSTGRWDAGVQYSVYLQGNLKIWTEISYPYHTRPFYDIYVSQGGQAEMIGESYGWSTQTFSVKDGWIYANYRINDSTDNVVPVRVNIQTKEIEIIE